MNIKESKPSVIIFLLIVFSVNQLFGQAEKIQLNEWITSWQLLGPLPLEESTNELKHLPGFDKDFLSKHGGEINPKVKIGKQVKIGDSKLSWIDYTGTEPKISLDNSISKLSYVAAYAYKEIYTEDDGTYIFSLGTNDGARLWINGVQVWDHPGARGCIPDSDLIPIFLQKGINTILIKIEEKGNSWEFCARILPFNIDAFTKKGALFSIVTLSNGVPELRFSLSEAVIENLFKTIELEIYSDERSIDPIWSGEWTNEKRMTLDVTDQGYKPYTLKIIAERQDGIAWENELLFNAGERIDYTLFEGRKIKYRIVVGKDASESEKWAATELQKSLMKISGANFVVDNDDSEITDHEIIIGYNKHSKKLLGSDFSQADVLDESFLYKNVKSNIILAGGKQRGTMYAVFSFLENTFGVRWYTPEVTVTPSRKNFAFDYLNHQEKPSLQVRNDFYYEAFDPTWAAHNKINGAMGFREQHGDIEGYWAVHTFYRFMPPSEFYDEHPEYYSLIDGKRIHDHAQLCLTNPDVLEIITERLKKAMRENPSNLIYSVSQNDWRNPCQCDNCSAIVKIEGSEAGVMVWFVNQVADNVKEEFPNKYVGTLAYQYTRKPPEKIKPKENVVIRLCSIECCFAHDFKSCPENQAFLNDLEEWASISPHLYIWDYVVNFSHYTMPYPNFNVLQSNIKTFRDNNSIGIMEQAAYQSRGGEFAELRAYVISKILWNAECDVNLVIDDFIYGYYGRSGQYVREYLDFLHDQITPDTHIHLGLDPNDKIFSDKFIQEADKIFDQAEVVAGSDVMKERVELARLPLMYLKCKRNPVVSKYDGTFDRLNKIVEREGITHFAERGKPHMDAFFEQVNNAE